MSWDDDDFELEIPDALKEEEKPKVVPEAAKPKSSKASADEPVDPEAEAAKERLRKYKMEMEAAEDLFGFDDDDYSAKPVKGPRGLPEPGAGHGAGAGASAPAPEDLAGMLEAMSLTTDEEISALVEHMSRALLSKKKPKTTITFLKELITGVTEQLRIEDLKDLSRHADVERNKKIEAAKPKKKGGKKKAQQAKRTLAHDRDDDWMNQGGTDGIGDDFDFM